MIQRIQTVYLLLSALCMYLTFVFDYATLDLVTEKLQFNNSGIIFQEKNLISIPFSIVAALIGTLSLGTIFLFRKRQLQLRLGRLSYILHLFVIVAIFFAADNAVKALPAPEAVRVSYDVGFYLPVAALAFLFLANRSIKKDEELVRSLDRLRG